MSTQLEMLEAGRREILAHLAIFPEDAYGRTALIRIEEAIISATPPAMRHMRERANLGGRMPKAEAAIASYNAAMEKNVPLPHPCQICDGHIPCCRCVQAPTEIVLVSAKEGSKVWYDNQMSMDGYRPATGHRQTPKSVRDVTKDFLFGQEPLVGPFFTFGADHDQDQLWLAAEREKVAGTREDIRTVSSKITGANYNPDNYMFPTMAFNLTSMHNVKYGTNNY
jgi:hypothetical protein